MLIMSQNKKEIVNLETIKALSIDNDDDLTKSEVYAWYGNIYPDDAVALGFYETERAKEILKEIAERQGGISTYYMPEE